jgi:hypothetical protein
MAAQSSQSNFLRQKVDKLRETEQEVQVAVEALHQHRMGLMEDGPTTFFARKLREKRIRKATRAFDECKEALILVKTNLRAAEIALKIALDRERVG